MLEVHCENRTILEALTARLLAAGETGPALPRRVPAAVRRGRGDRPGHRAGGGGRGAAVRRAPLVGRGARRRFAAAKARGRPVFAETCPHYLTLTDDRYALPPEEAATLRDLAAAPRGRQSRGAVGRPGRRRARAGRDRPRAGPGGGREAELARVVRPDLERRAGDRDAARRWPGTAAWPPGRSAERLVDAPVHDAGAAVRPAAKGRDRGRAATRTSCCSIPRPGARCAPADLHHTSDYTPYEGRAVRGAVRSTIVRGSFVVRDGAFVGTRGHGRFVERALEPMREDRRSVEAAVRLEGQELGEVVGQDEAVEERGGLGHAARARAPIRSSSSSRIAA